MKTSIICLMLISIFSSGCATILQSGPDRIPVTSEPSGANVTVNGFPAGQTPTYVRVERKDDCVIRIEKEGYQPIEEERSKVLSGWFLGNLAWGPFAVIGLGTDLATSNQGKHSDAPLFFKLTPKEKISAAK